MCADAEVGVDVEAVPDDVSDPVHERLARRLLSPAESAVYAAAPPAERPAALMACWTRKEAHGKARGTGLVFPLVEIEAWAGDERPVAVGDVRVHAVAVSELERALGARLAGAVAVAAEPGRQISVTAAPVWIDPATLSG